MCVKIVTFYFCSSENCRNLFVLMSVLWKRNPHIERIVYIMHTNTHMTNRARDRERIRGPASSWLNYERKQAGKRDFWPAKRAARTHTLIKGIKTDFNFIIITNIFFILFVYIAVYNVCASVSLRFSFVCLCLCLAMPACLLVCLSSTVRFGSVLDSRFLYLVHLLWIFFSSAPVCACICHASFTWILLVFFNFLRVFWKSFIFKFRFSFARINYGDCICVALIAIVFEYSSLFFSLSLCVHLNPMDTFHAFVISRLFVRSLARQLVCSLCLIPICGQSFIYSVFTETHRHTETHIAHRMPNKFPYLLFKVRLLLCRELVGSKCMHENVAFVIMFSLFFCWTKAKRGYTKKECIWFGFFLLC